MSKSASLCTVLTAALIATAQPAAAQPLSTRLDARSAVSASRSSDWYQWPTAKKPPERKSDDTVVTDSHKRGPVGLIVLGGGVVAAGVGTVFGLRNKSATSDYRSAQTAAARLSAHDQAASSATIANVSFIASGLLLAAGLGLLFFTDL